MASNKNAAIRFIFLTLLIDVIGIGLIIPVMPGLIQQLIHGSISQASTYSGWLMFAYSVMQFFFSPLLGNLSDRYGRRPILLISLLGLGIDYIFLSLAPTIGWLFVGRIIAGIGGASFTTATAYIADVSTPEDKAKNFGMVGAAFGLGFIIGPVIGGLLSGWGVRTPFVFAAVLSFINCLYGYFVLPESLSKEHRRAFDWKKANPVSTLKKLKKYPAIGGLVIAFFLVYLGGLSVQTTWTFYTIKKFAWSVKYVGISLGVVGVLVAIVQGGLIRFINPKLGDKRSVYVGVGLQALGLFLFSYATQGWMMYVVLLPYCLGGICGPAFQSIMSSQVPPNEQGELQGGVTSVISLSSIIGPPLMTNLFSVFTGNHAPFYFPGAAFFVGGVLMLVSVLIAYITLQHLEHIS